MAEEFTPQSVAGDAKATPRQNLFIVPIAIIIGFALIAAAIFFSGSNPFQKQTSTFSGLSAASSSDTTSTKIPPVTASDHILGNPNAPIMLVEYSDLDCPFCKEFNSTMHQIIDEYGPSGKVAWVFREFPIQQLHPNAPALALDAECVAKIGGNDAFWKFTDAIYNGRDVTQETDMAKIPDYVAAAGVDQQTFQNCVNNGSLKEKVKKEFNEAIKAGAKGTPYTVVMVGGQQGVINGAQPYSAVKKIIDTLLTQLGSTNSEPTFGTSTTSSTGQ